MLSRAEIKTRAREALKANYGNVLIAIILYTVVSSLLATVGLGVAALILAGPLAAALSWALLGAYRGCPCGVSEMFSRGFDNVGRKIGGYLWMWLWLFLWLLVFYIPGFVKALSYSMTPFILADMPNVPAKDALKLSMRMMNGHKWDLFVLYLSFFGWILLSSLTFGILTILYVSPYMQLAMAGFYDEVKQDAINRGILVPAEPLPL